MTRTVETKSFQYLGFTFNPVRNFNRREAHLSFNNRTRRLRRTGIHNHKTTPGLSQNWNYNEFYQTAQDAGCGNFDLYSVELNGKSVLVVPGENELWQWEPLV